MANFDNRYTDGNQGLYFIDQDCIACDTCGIVAPQHFVLTSDFDHAMVCKQPETAEEIRNCESARQACPVCAIGKHDAALR